MNASRTKPKPPPITKPKQPRSKPQEVRAPSAGGTAAPRKHRRDIKSVIAKLDVASLHDDDIISILNHATSVLAFRKAVASPAVARTESLASYCYTKSGSSPMVNVWNGNFKVDEMTEDEAKARHIPPCG